MLLENFVNARNKQFSEVYFKATTQHRSSRALTHKRPSSIASRQIVEPINSSSHNNTNKDPTFENNVLLFKLRKIFFNALPSHKKHVANILKRSWLSKINQSEFDSQNGLRLEVRIYEVANYLTFGMDDTFGFKYTIAINGQDPKFLGVEEPTFDDYIRETNVENVPMIKFCDRNTFEIERIYFDSSMVNIDSVLDKLWLDSHQFTKRTIENHQRIERRSKLNHAYYDSNKNNITRLEISWLVDGAEPNPIYFNRPSIQKIIKLLSDSNVKVFTDVPYMRKDLYVIENSKDISHLVESAIQQSWQLVNPLVDTTLFKVFLENGNTVDYFNSTSMQLPMVGSSLRLKRSVDNEPRKNGLVYFIGIGDQKFDINDVREPSIEIIKRSLKERIPDIEFINDSNISSDSFISMVILF